MTELDSTEGELTALTAALRHFDWAPRAKVPGHYEVWSGESPDDEVIIPLDPNRGDYAGLLERATQAVSRRFGEEAVRVRALVSMQLRSALGLTQWKKETAVDAGLIPWSEGESLYAAARGSLVAAAKASREMRMQHGAAGAHLAKRFLEHSFMGQTEIGSFIITAHTPSAERFHVSQASEEATDPRKAETISGSAILLTLERSLQATRSGLDEYRVAPTAEVFVDLVKEGVSYELVRALQALTSDGDAAVEIRHFDANALGPAREITFDAPESAVLDKVARRFARTREAEQVNLIGEVTLLNHASNDPIHLIGLAIHEGADVRKARVRLTPNQYRIALDAHAASAYLRVSGRLEREGKLSWLTNPTGVEVVPFEERPRDVPDMLFGDDGTAIGTLGEGELE